MDHEQVVSGLKAPVPPRGEGCSLVLSPLLNRQNPGYKACLGDMGTTCFNRSRMKTLSLKAQATSFWVGASGACPPAPADQGSGPSFTNREKTKSIYMLFYFTLPWILSYRSTWGPFPPALSHKGASHTTLASKSAATLWWERFSATADRLLSRIHSVL